MAERTITIRLELVVKDEWAHCDNGFLLRQVATAVESGTGGKIITGRARRSEPIAE